MAEAKRRLIQTSVRFGTKKNTKKLHKRDFSSYVLAYIIIFL